MMKEKSSSVQVLLESCTKQKNLDSIDSSIESEKQILKKIENSSSVLDTNHNSPEDDIDTHCESDSETDIGVEINIQFDIDDDVSQASQPDLQNWCGPINMGAIVGAHPIPGIETNVNSDELGESMRENNPQNDQNDVHGGLVHAHYVENSTGVIAIASPIHSNQIERNDDEAPQTSFSWSKMSKVLFLWIFIFILLGVSSYMWTFLKSVKEICTDSFKSEIEYLNPPLNWEQIGESIQGTREHEYIGSSVSMCSNGERLAVGSYAQYGHYARIYDYVNGAWTISFDFSEYLPLSQEGKDDGSTMSQVSFSHDCNRLAIGMPSYDGPIFSQYQNGRVDMGTFVVFDFDQGSNKWIQLGETSFENYPWYAQIGHSIEISGNGNRVVFGKYHLDEGELKCGVSVFDLKKTSSSNYTWELAYFLSEKVVHDYSIAIDSTGSKIAIGEITTNSKAGKVTLYDLSEPYSTSNLYGSKGDMYGDSVTFSKDGNRLAIGTKFTPEHIKNNYVRVFQYNSQLDTWDQLGNDICGENIDISFSENGDTLAVASPTGIHIYMFKHGEWAHSGKFNEIESNTSTELTISLSADGNRLAVGPRAHERNKSHVLVFERKT